MTASSLAVVALDAPGSVARARRWLRGEIGWAPAELQDVAELVLSELVTNAVLHAPGPMRVSLSRRDDCVALEVVDTNPDHVPEVRHYSSDATTGRGMHVVDRLSAAWGVRGLAAGKGVWALLADPAEPQAGIAWAEAFSPGTWLLDDPTRAQAPRPAGTDRLPVEQVVVQILGLPLWVYFAAQEHNDALLREFQLVATADPADHIPRRLLELAEEVRVRFAAEGTKVRGQVAAAVAAGATTVDLELTVANTSWELVSRLARQLDEADEFCARGELLTLASPPVVRQFRSWYLGQITDQLQGLAPSPWPGPFEPTVRRGPAEDDKEAR